MDTRRADARIPRRPAGRRPTGQVVRARWSIAVAEVAVAIAGGMITLTGFVVTAVTLMVQTIQSQSPRLLRVLDRTDTTPLLFGTFTATFTFALVALSQVRPDSVPNVSVTLALALVLVSAGLFLRLLVTFRTTLTVGGLARRIGNRLREQIDIQYPARFDPALRAAAAAAPVPAAPVPAAPVPAEPEPSWLIRYDGESGVFQAFDERTGEVRTLEQDPAYGIRMLVDIALRALSPAVNDPSSAVQALDQLDDILQRLAARSLGDGRLLDGSGRVLVRFTAPQWDAFLALALDEIILYSAGSIQVTRRLSALLDDLLAGAPASRRPPVGVRAARLRRAVRRALPDEEQAAEAMQPDHQGIGSPRETL